MPELRRDPIIGRWVIIAAERGVRPTDFARPRRAHGRLLLSILPGQRGLHPPRGLGLPADGSPTAPAGSSAWCPTAFQP